MKRVVKSLLGIALAAAVAAPATVFATNGMFLIGLGTKSRGMGGISLAHATDSMASATNPAAALLVKNRFDIGADYFRPLANARLGDFEEGSRANTFLIPHMGGVMKFNPKIHFAMTAVGVAGGGSRYNRNLYNLARGGGSGSESFINKTMGVNLMVMQMNPTMAINLNRNHGFGATLIMAVQTFRAFGLGEFNAFTPIGGKGGQSTHLTNRGNDYAYGGGVRLGWMSKFMKKKLKVGLMASSKVYMSRFRKYDDLFAEGTLDTPEQVGVGVSYGFGKRNKVVVAFDWMRTFYSNVNSISNVGPNPGAGCPLPNCNATDGSFDESRYRLGESKGLGFGWNNQDVFKLGLEYKHDKRWTFRTGWNYGESPIQEEREIIFNITAPAVVQHHLTLGFTYKPSRNGEINFSYVHAYRFEQEGPTYIGSSGEIEMSQDSLGLAWGIKF